MVSTCRINSRHFPTAKAIYDYLYPNLSNTFRLMDIPGIKSSSCGKALIREGWITVVERGPSSRVPNKYRLSDYAISKLE